jgi:hypothetical protein
MATDAQSLLDQAWCMECMGSSEYALDLMEVALLAKWAKGGSTPVVPCVPPGAPAVLLETDSPLTVGILLTLPIPNPTVGVIIRWGTVPGGPYPNSKSFALTGAGGQGPYNVTTSDGLTPGITYDFIAFSDNGNGCISAASGEVQGTPQQSLLNQEWQGRVTAAGGPIASQNTYDANDAFVAALAAAGITAKVKVANLFAPDSLSAARTPLIQGPGSGSWDFSATNFLAGDLTINGLGDAANTAKALFTGFAPANFMTSGTNHGCVYISVDDTTFGSTEYGVNDGTGLNDFVINSHWTDKHTYAYNYAQPQFLDTGILSAGALLGYFCCSRTTTSRADLYYANSTNVHASKANNAILNGAVPPAVNIMFVFALNNNGALAQVSKKRISAATFGTGLLAAESLALFNAIQAFRQKIGGGFA